MGVVVVWEVEGEEVERDKVGGAWKADDENDGLEGCTDKGGTVAMGTVGRVVCCLGKEEGGW